MMIPPKNTPWAVLGALFLFSPEALNAQWPSFAGDGGFANPPQGLHPVRSPQEVQLAWQTPVFMGVQKSKDAVGDEFYGGTACLITGEGKVFGTFFQPAGEILNEKTANRYYALEKQPRSLRLIDADDVTVALDAETGKELWRAVEKQAGMNFLFCKRGHYGVSPAYGAGKVFVWGALGRIYAYEAATGRKIWDATAEKFHAAATAAKQKALADRAILDIEKGAKLFEDLRTGLIICGGTLVAPDGFGGLIGFDPASGGRRWALPDSIARGATPSIWRAAASGKEFLLCPADTKSGGLVRLVDPADGRVLWSLNPGGANHTSLVVGGDFVLLNTRGHPRDRTKDNDRLAGKGLFACYELSVEGAQQVWALEDKEENWHVVRPDRGKNRRIVIRDGIAYVLLGPDLLALTEIELRTGKILSRTGQNFSGTACSPVFVENLLILPLDLSHSWGKAALTAFEVVKPGELRPWEPLPLATLPGVELTTDYEVANEMPTWNGKLYAKTRKGVAALRFAAP